MRNATLATTMPTRQTADTTAIPADAAAWLRTHFDWTRGAVALVCERWDVDAVTVVAWAEKLHAGGKAGAAHLALTAHERDWLVAHLSDPDEELTAGEMADVRAFYARREAAEATEATEAAGVASIRDIDDAVVVIAARQATDATPLGALLLDDLRVLREEQRGETQHETEVRRETMSDPAPMTAASGATATLTATDTAIDTPKKPTAAPRIYPTREAQCARCGASFTSHKYTSGWTQFCSRACGGAARGWTDGAPKPPSERLTSAATAPTPPDAPPDAPRHRDSHRDSDDDNRLVAGLRVRACEALGSGDTDSDDAGETPDFALLHALIERLPTGGMWSAQAVAVAGGVHSGA